MQLRFLFAKCQKVMEIENIRIGSGGTRRRIIEKVE